mgnify:CR=1 FL=1
MTLMSSSSSSSSFLSVRRHGFSPSRVLYLEKRCFCEEDDCFNINEKIAKAKAQDKNQSAENQILNLLQISAVLIYKKVACIDDMSAFYFKIQF